MQYIFDHLGPIVDWIYDQKYIAYPPNGIKQPNLCMKKRDPEATLRSVEEWHKQLGRVKKGGNLVWNSSGIRAFELNEGEIGARNYKCWIIKELLSSKELQIEGREMHHCASSYAGSCNNGRISIWTMELTTVEGTRKRATLEVQSGKIVQARGKYNEKLGILDKNIVGRWAHQSGLSLSSWL